MVNVTEIRTGIREVLSELAKTREPIVVLQRSKPVAYLVDPETFEKLWHADGHVSLKEKETGDIRQSTLAEDQDGW